MAKEDKYIQNNKWYHGTTLYDWKRICKIGIQADFNKGNELDFGYGFYFALTEIDAENYIKRLLSYKLPTINNKRNPDKEIAVVIEFEFSILEWMETNVYESFISYDDDFAEFVFYNRMYNVNGENHHEYDFIFGVMSDSNPTELFPKYKNNEISKIDVINGLKKSTSMKQLSLHNQSLCDIIKPNKAYSLFENSRKELDINEYTISRK